MLLEQLALSWPIVATRSIAAVSCVSTEHELREQILNGHTSIDLCSRLILADDLNLGNRTLRIGCHTGQCALERAGEDGNTIIATEGHNLVFENITFSNDRRNYDTWSSTMEFVGGQVRMENCVFRDLQPCGSVVTAGEGQGIELVRCLFINLANHCTDGILALSSAASATLRECVFANNFVYEYLGGAIFLSDTSRTVIEHSVFDDNYAYDYGGALYITTSRYVTLRNVTFNQNRANGIDHRSQGNDLFVCEFSEVVCDSFTRHSLVQENSIGGSGTVDTCLTSNTVAPMKEKVG